VTAHVRGGGEHGRLWHMAATVHRKWAALYDYAAAANYLVDAGITAPGHIACDAFSAGVLILFIARLH
jgi:protease II